MTIKRSFVSLALNEWPENSQVTREDFANTVTKLSFDHSRFITYNISLIGRAGQPAKFYFNEISSAVAFRDQLKDTLENLAETPNYRLRLVMKHVKKAKKERPDGGSPDLGSIAPERRH